MKSVFQTIMLGVGVIVAFDTIASLISASTGIWYGLFSIGSFLIYVIFGFLAAKRSRWFFGAIAGAIIALAESTIGWAISWYIGPGRLEMEIDAVSIVITIIFVLIPIGTFLGLFGGLVSLLGKNHA